MRFLIKANKLLKVSPFPHFLSKICDYFFVGAKYLVSNYQFILKHACFRNLLLKLSSGNQNFFMGWQWCFRGDIKKKNTCLVIFARQWLNYFVAWFSALFELQRSRYISVLIIERGKLTTDIIRYSTCFGGQIIWCTSSTLEKVRAFQSHHLRFIHSAQCSRQHFDPFS